MKKYFAMFLCILLLFSLCACASMPHIVERGNKTFEIDYENNTISDGRHIYAFTFSGDAIDYVIELTYPNGATYCLTQSQYFGTVSTSDDYKELIYTKGEVLCDLIAEHRPGATIPAKAIAIVILFLGGIFQIIAPNTALYIAHGWKYKNAEPSDFALGCCRVAGVAAIVIGAALILIP